MRFFSLRAWMRIFSWGILLMGLTSCYAIITGGGTGEATSNTATGSGQSEVPAGETSVTMRPPEGFTWSIFTIDLGSHFTAENICSGKTIFGRLGTAACGFATNSASNAHRDFGTTQITQQAEIDSGLTSGYRHLPDTTKDDDGFRTAANGCSGAGGTGNTCSTDTYLASRPTVDCGTSGTIDERIADCAADNPSSSSWDGAARGLQGEGLWRLVTRLSDAGRDYEVWRDERTKLIWSDRIGDLTTNVNQGRFSWCLAAGNVESNATGLECRTSFAGSLNNVGVSLCFDDGTGALITPNGMADSTAGTDLAAWTSTGTDSQQNNIIRAKGNMSSLT